MNSYILWMHVLYETHIIMHTYIRAINIRIKSRLLKTYEFVYSEDARIVQDLYHYAYIHTCHKYTNKDMNSYILWMHVLYETHIIMHTYIRVINIRINIQVTHQDQYVCLCVYTYTHIVYTYAYE